MSDYISREAAIRVIDELYVKRPLDSDRFVLTGVGARLEELPAADVRPVVYCKDCRHRDPEDHKCDSGERERHGCPFKVADDYFCAFGEK